MNEGEEGPKKLTFKTYKKTYKKIVEEKLL